MRTLMVVHAHPDDESILTGGVIARAHDDGHRVVLVTATGGEDADSDGDGGHDDSIRDLRLHELDVACGILGVDRLQLLGYRGCGLDGPAAQDGAFVSTPIATAAHRVAEVLREEHPDVVVTYGADGTYGHPDHVQTHAVTIAALDLVVGDAWAPRKVYLHTVPQSFVVAVVDAASSHGIELARGLSDTVGTPDDDISTVVDVTSVLDRKLAACVAHASQMHPGLALATMAAELFETAFGSERFMLTRGGPPANRPEHDLFAGLQ